MPIENLLLILVYFFPFDFVGGTLELLLSVHKLGFNVPNKVTMVLFKSQSVK